MSPAELEIHTGACLCGGVAYEVRGPLRDVILCHCARCRRTHGHVAAYTECRTGQLTLEDEEWLRWYDADERQRGFCGRCGASVFWREAADPDTISIAAGTLDPPTGLRTTEQIYLDSAGDYYALSTEGNLHAEGLRVGAPQLMTANGLPILWQLEMSHYNEKARWALDFKRIPHVRRALLPGLHLVVARRLTDGTTETTPVLTLDGRSIGDSTAIIAALEERWPQPPLYPADRAERQRALELEEYFDEELGPHLRRALYHELLTRPELVVPLMVRGQRRFLQLLFRLAFPILASGIRQRFGVSDAAARDSRERSVAVMERIERELGPSGYLVGDRFTVADLAAASLLYPVVRPPQFPYPTVTDPPGEAGAFLDALARRPAGRWVSEMYARHRMAATPIRR